VFKPKNFILDVDGVLTDGKFHYSSKGKIIKVFGPDDSDALSIAKQRLNILMISGDRAGFSISKKRIVDDMGFKLELVSPFERLEWIKKQYKLNETIYMGDGFFDPLVFEGVGYSIAPNNALPQVKKFASYTTVNDGGGGAVTEAVLHILDKFFDGFNLFSSDFKKEAKNWINN
jgi:3-deoxy-D-manno-octulosonate 8-phosphate phosphatase (KDO 8-P phosphatase)